MTSESIGSAMDDVTSRAAGALLGTFVGDALGMPWEGRPGWVIPETLEMEEARRGAGTYTDDTQMMIALAESLLRCDVVDEDDLGRTFVAHFDPTRGYGSGTVRVLDRIAQGVPAARAAGEAFDGRGSLGNGAAMRIAPVGVRYMEDPVLLGPEARRSARVTHTHPVGVDAAAAQAAAVAAAAVEEDPFAAARREATSPEVRRALKEVHARTAGNLGSRSLWPAREGVPPLADVSVAVAIVAASSADTFEEAVTVGVRAGGDTDTVGAMAGAIAGARFGVDAIPTRWLDALEDGERGRTHVLRLAYDLAIRAQSPVTGSVVRGS